MLPDAGRDRREAPNNGSGRRPLRGAQTAHHPLPFQNPREGGTGTYRTRSASGGRDSRAEAARKYGCVALTRPGRCVNYEGTVPGHPREPAPPRNDPRLLSTPAGSYDGKDLMSE